MSRSTYLAAGKHAQRETKADVGTSKKAKRQKLVDGLSGLARSCIATKVKGVSLG